MSDDQAKGGVESFMQTTLEASLLKASAGRAIFCPNCEDVMDWRRTVVATVHGAPTGKPEECLKAYVVCDHCWDKLGKDTVDGVASSNARLGERGHARLEVVDGRDARFDAIEEGGA